MLDLYFGNFFSILTLIFVAGLIALIVIAIKRRNTIGKWGRLILLFVIAGTAVSAFSAIRDAYAAPNALFAMDSMQSIVCSVAGGLIFLLGILSLFFKNQKVRRASFFSISALFLAQVLVIEISRMVLYISGAM